MAESEALQSHRARSVRGVVWNFLRVFGQTFLSLGAGIILARLLPPADFGLLAIAMVFVGFAELVASAGMGPAVVQRRQLTEAHLRVATTLSLVVGILLVTLLCAAAPGLGRFFDDNRVAEILPVLAIGVGFSTVSAVSRGLLVRQMNFRKLFVIDVTAYLVGYAVIAITLAVLDMGVWSLVIGTTVSLSLQGAALLLVAPLRFPLSLSRNECRELLGFGVGFSLNNTINYIAANVDYLIIGKWLDSTRLGLYTRAYQLVAMPVAKISATLSGALFPSYSEIQGNREHLGRAYLKAVSATSLLTFPVLGGFAVSADTVIVGLYGENWQEASAALRILALAGIFKSIFHLAGTVAQATGNIYAEVRRQIGYLAILAIGCALAVPWGIEAVAFAVVVGSFSFYLAMAQLACHITGCRWRDFFHAQLPGIAMAIVVAVTQVAWLTTNAFVTHLPASPSLAILILLSAVVGGGSLLLLPPRIVGPVPAWLCLHYADRLPAGISGWLKRRFS